MLAGCSTLQPLSQPRVSALAPANGLLWSDTEGVRQEDWYHLLNEGPDALSWRLRAIDSATRSLDLQTFLWKPDRSGLSVLRQIMVAADRGVRIRILLDDTFTIHEDHLLVRLSAHPAIDVRIYNPFARRFDSFVLREAFSINEFARIDRRMHNKLMLVDNRVAIVGGRNIADEYFGLHAEANFRDLEVILFGDPVGRSSALFDSYWNSPWAYPVEQVVGGNDAVHDVQSFREWLADSASPRVPEDPASTRAAWKRAARDAVGGNALLFSDEPATADPLQYPDASDKLAAALVHMVADADDEIVIVTAYLIPTPQLEAAFRQAARKGVRIRVLTNSLRSNNHTAAHSAYRGFIRRLMSIGIEMHEVRAEAKDRHLYMARPVADKHLALHAKILLVDDDLTFVGSANLDPRSLHLNTEVGVLVDSPALNRRVREQIAVDFSERNAWRLAVGPDDRLQWIGDDIVLQTQPAESGFQRLEDWFFSLLPIRNEL